MPENNAVGAVPPPAQSTSYPILSILAVAVGLCSVILTPEAVYLVAHGNEIGSVDKLSKLGKGGGLVALAVLYGIVTVVR